MGKLCLFMDEKSALLIKKILPMKKFILSLATVLCCFATLNAQVNVTCDGGSWQSEVSWTITDASGAVFTGGAPYSGDLALACGAYTVDMVDAYGDGWNGNTLSIGMDSFTIDYGASASGSGMNGSMVSVSCDGGSWQSEVSWTITSVDGSTLSGGAPFAGEMCLTGEYTVDMVDAYGDGWNGNVLTVGAATFTIDMGASASGSGNAAAVYGCTDSTACNFNADATADDASCTYADQVQTVMVTV